jgi:hypothetical protein
LFSLLVLALGGGCAKSPAPPLEAPSNTSAPTSASEPAPSGPITNEPLPLGPAGSCAVGGAVIALQSDGPLAGTTILLVGVKDPERGGEKALISDKDGRFLFHAPEVPQRVELYYAEKIQKIDFGPSACGRALRVGFDE